MTASLLKDMPDLLTKVKEGQALYVEMRTPEGPIYSGGSSSVIVPGAKGSIGVLPKHAPLLSSLEVGFTRIRDPLGKEWKFVTGMGFVEIQNNEILILVDFAEDVNDIDVERAEEARNRAQERLRAPGADVDGARADAAKHRAMMRLRFATR
ncbi:MAG: ATP synthase F1 subunit epsilon [Planctomycetota bacterium]|jgi:F-type H+-transporting ATPase subunit epsilon|nr:ATP synthase F1 subunit epsilon [Planctomycetota bacterium]